MKPVLFLLNITIEGPGTLATFLEQRNIPLEIRDLYASNSLPDSPSNYGALVVMGGPMNVDDEDKYPYLKAEKAFIRQTVEEGLPILGFCLGGQLLASALDAAVYKGAHSEIGWMNVTLTQAGKHSPLFAGLPQEFEVFQWHSGQFDLPNQSKRLADSALCENQAFQYGEKIFGLQFHLDADATKAAKWAQAYLPQLRGEDRLEAYELIGKPDQETSMRVQQNAQQVFKNFFCTIAGYNQTRN